MNGPAAPRRPSPTCTARHCHQLPQNAAIHSRSERPESTNTYHTHRRAFFTELHDQHCEQPGKDHVLQTAVHTIDWAECRHSACLPWCFAVTARGSATACFPCSSDPAAHRHRSRSPKPGERISPSLHPHTGTLTVIPVLSACESAPPPLWVPHTSITAVLAHIDTLTVPSQ